MTTRPRLTAALALLVAVMQLAAVGAAPNDGRARQSVRYFCCCAGECHCTADCCNHPPESAGSDTARGPRLGPDTPVLEAPRSCGTWTATVSRGPEAPKAPGTAAQQRADAPPDPSRWRATEPDCALSTLPATGPSSPRAPPEPVTSV